MTTPQTTTPPQAFAPIRAFKAGRRTDSAGNVKDWTAADLHELAESYDPKLREAPIVIGHPKDNAPAYGWVGGVASDGKVLDAVPSSAQPEFQDWVKRELYKQISISVYGRNHPNNPVPGKLYLRHVGFLGAQPPAIAGLTHSFAEDAGSEELLEYADWTVATTARLFRGMRDWLIAQFGQEAADKALPSYEVQQLADDAVREPITPTQPAGLSFSEGNTPMSGTNGGAAAPDLAARETALAEATRKLAEDQAAHNKRVADGEAAVRASQFSDFADGLVRQGRLLPKDKAAIVNVLGALPDATVLEFGEGDGLVKKPAAEVLQDFMKTLPVIVDFSERARDDNKPRLVDGNNANAIAIAAQDFQESERKAGRAISIDAAVQHVATNLTEA